METDILVIKNITQLILGVMIWTAIPQIFILLAIYKKIKILTSLFAEKKCGDNGDNKGNSVQNRIENHRKE